MTIRARSRRNVVISMFLGLWVIAWIVTQVMGPARFMPEDTTPAKFAWVWWGLWTPGGLLVLYAFLWSIVGWEQVRVEPGALSLKRSIFGLGRVRRYDAARIRNLRLYGRTADITFRKPAVVGGGKLAFDYGAAVVRFVDDIKDADAEPLLQRIRSRLTTTTE